MFLPVPSPQFFGGSPPKPPVPRRSLPKGRAERRRLAWRLGSLLYPSPEQQATLMALGRDSVSALIFYCDTASGERLERLIDALARNAGPERTREIWSLIQRIRASPRTLQPFATPWASLEGWLRLNGDPSFLGRVYLPKLKKAEDVSEWSVVLPFLVRCRDKPVVDYLAGVLRDEKADPYLRREIFGFIAATNRRDVLDWIRKTRPIARRRSTPNPEMSIDRDLDGDGICDAFDVNPFVAPRKLSEEERAMQVAFESQVRFSKGDRLPVAMGYPSGYRPFELLGLDGTIVPASNEIAGKAAEIDDKGRFRYWHVSLELKDPDPKARFDSKKTVCFPRGATTASVFYASVGAPAGGAGYEIELRKIRGEWYVVRVAQQWVA